MLFLVLIAVGAVTAAPVPHVYVVTESTPLENYVIVEPIPEAPAFPPLRYGMVGEDKRGFIQVAPAERSAPKEEGANNAKLEVVDVDDASPSEDDANNEKPVEDDDDAKSEDDDANDTKPEGSEHHEKESEKPIPPGENKIPPSLAQERPLIIKVEDPKPSVISLLPSFVPAFQLPSLSNVPGFSRLPSLPFFSNLNLPSLSSFSLPTLPSLNLPSLSDFHLPSFSPSNIPGLSSIFGSSPSSRYIVYRSY